jgi:secreted trypsin-like serine protease
MPAEFAQHNCKDQCVSCVAVQVLKLLQESTGNILDDEVLINVLNNSKSTSGEYPDHMKEILPILR